MSEVNPCSDVEGIEGDDEWGVDVVEGFGDLSSIKLATALILREYALALESRKE
jgi:hypothetical protein